MHETVQEYEASDADDTVEAPPVLVDEPGAPFKLLDRVRTPGGEGSVVGAFQNEGSPEWWIWVADSALRVSRLHSADSLSLLSRTT